MKQRKMWIWAIGLVIAVTGCGKNKENLSLPDNSVISIGASEETLEATTEPEPMVRELDFETIDIVTNEEEALSALERLADLKTDEITFRYGGSDTNGAETWYDFIECYHYTPVWGEIIRIHVFPDCSQVQGKLLLSGFEAPDYTLSGEEILNVYAKKENVITDNYICVEMCYLHVAGNDTIPLCYHYTDEVNEIFLEAKTGELVAQRTNLIIG